MTFSTIWSENSLKQLRKLDQHVAKRIITAVEGLKENPYRHVKKIIGEDKTFRLRVGDYRVLMDISNQQLHVLVLKIGHRSMIYKR
ncbi:MAG: type II toxin-antitoxin system RelE/ParE family toxin [Candidatus Aenigmarchaeota archaeon]|nr:type II toxin-antitoxin system RelE/ParE family toxin [Candidatus Aenigmarchaeota archaeon]